MSIIVMLLLFSWIPGLNYNPATLTNQPTHAAATAHQITRR